MSVRITVSGDFCITGQWVEQQLAGDDIIGLFSKQDFNVVNLECPVVENNLALRIPKHGPHIRTEAAVFRQLEKLKSNVVTLANNHILDYGDVGLLSTINACLANGVTFCGVGKHLSEAALPVMIEKDDVRIALVNCCENEWSIAGEQHAGANPYDIIDITRQLSQAKAMADFVLLIIHGGNEAYELPSPRMQKQFRFLSQQGADVVICHHSHCISGMEVYKGVPIFYGLGNMIFTKALEVPDWNQGLSIRLLLESNKPVQWEIIPTIQDTTNFRLSLATGTSKAQIEERFTALNAIIADPVLLQKKWNEFVQTNSAQYLYTLSAMNAVPGRYLRAILKRLGFMKLVFPERYLKGMLNYINCEAHLDVSRDVISRKLYNK